MAVRSACTAARANAAFAVLMSLAADDKEGRARIDAFVQGLRELGWTDGRNVQIDIRWAAGGDRIRQQYAAELVALSPDVMEAAL